MRVTSTVCPSETSFATSAPICSGLFRSPKTTSGTPCRSARSPSSWAKSATCCTGRSAIRRAASSTETFPARTASRNSFTARASIAGDLRRSVGLQHAFDGPARRDLCARLRGFHARSQKPPERPRGIRGAEVRQLPQRLDLLRRELERRDRRAVLHLGRPLQPRCILGQLV